MNSFGLTLISLTIATVSCSNQDFKSGGNGLRKSEPRPCGNSQERCPPPSPEPTPPPSKSIQTHEAVFAVRNLSCAMCHAKIDSNVISNFAAGTGVESATQSLSSMLFVVSHPDSSKSQPEVKGNFIVPSGEIDVHSNSENGADGNIDCSKSGFTSTANSKVRKANLIAVLKKCVEPKFNWSGDSKKFVGRSKVDINPVSSPADIKAIATTSEETSALSQSGFTVIGSSTIEGISGAKASGFKSASEMKCEGAVVFDGPILLKDTTISTQSGCRIYSIGAIFVFGSLSVTGPDNLANLQLMSPLFVGFDIATAKISTRLTHFLIKKQAFSRGTPTEVANLIMADASILQINALNGAGKSDYRRIAVSAPVVYSRSSGQFSGVIVAEQFLGKIGSLSFLFDPVFKSRVDGPAIFPEIKSELVTLSDDEVSQ